MTNDEIKCYPGGLEPQEAIAMLAELRQTLQVLYDTTPVLRSDGQKHLESQHVILDAIAALCTFHVRIEKEQP